jgi:hypothetical protein
MPDGKIIIELQGKDQATAMLVKNLQQLGQGAKAAEKDTGGAFTGMTGQMTGMAGQVKTFAMAHAGALASIAAGYVGMKGVKEFWEGFKAFAVQEAALVKTAARLNTTVEAVSALGYVGQKAGMETDSFNKALERLQKHASAAALGLEQAQDAVDEEGQSLVKGSQAFRELGINAEKFLQLPMEQKLMVFAEALQRNIDPMDRNRVAMEVFGREGGKLIPILAGGEEAIQKYIIRMEYLGGVISTQGAKAMAEAKAATSDLGIAWHNFGRELYEEAAPAITFIINKLTDLIVAARKVPPSMALAAETALEFAQNQEAQTKGFRGHGASGSWAPSDIIGAGDRSKPGKGGGGGGLESAQRQMENFIDSMRAEVSKIQGEGFSVLDAWFSKESRTLEALEAKVGESFTARLALQEAFEARRGKLIDDFADKERKAAKERQDQFEKSWLGSLELGKGLFDTLASTSPILSQQVIYKEKALELEILIGQHAFETKLLELEKAHIIETSQAEELRGLQALANQARRNFLEREKWVGQGLWGGMQIWAEDRSKNAGFAKQVPGLMNSLESGISSTISRGIIGALKGEKLDLSEIGWSLAEAFITQTVALGVSQLFTMFATSVLGMVPPMVAGATTSGAILTGAGAAVAAEMISGAITAAAIMSAARVATGGFLPWHSGGIVAHAGALVAHRGLAPDERFILAQTGEGIIKRDTMREYTRMGISFDDLNNARLPVVPISAPAASGREPSRTQVIEHHYHETYHVQAWDSEGVGRFLKRHGNKVYDAQRHPVRNHRQLSNFKNINGGQ